VILVRKFLVILLMMIFSVKSFAITPEKIEALKKTVVTIKVTFSRASYERLEPLEGGGFICDKAKGWIVTTHDLVGHGGVVATYELTFAGGQKLQARLVYADPSKDFAILEFNPKELLVDVDELKEFASTVALGEEILMVGKEGEQDIFQLGHISGRYENVSAFPQEALRISLNAAGSCIGAPILNKDNKIMGLVIQRDKTFVSALWGLFIRDALVDLKAGKIPVRRAIPAVAFSYSLADAVRYLKFPESQLTEFMKKYPDALAKGLVFLTVIGKESLLQPGDILWTVEGQEVGASLYKFESVLNRSQGKTVTLGVFREGKQIEVPVPLETLQAFSIREMVVWGGGIFYESDRWMERLYNIPPGSVTVSHALPGSPFSTVFSPPYPGENRFLNVINKIDGRPIQCLKDLIQQISRLNDKKYISIQYQDYSFYFVSGGYLSTSRNPKITGVNFLASTSIPEVLSFMEDKGTWVSKPIPLVAQACQKPIARTRRAG
jgi:S1-C subfamily serine protease